MRTNPFLFFHSGPVAKYRYVGKWSDQLRSLHGTVLNRIS